MEQGGMDLRLENPTEIGTASWPQVVDPVTPDNIDQPPTVPTAQPPRGKQFSRIHEKVTLLSFSCFDGIDTPAMILWGLVEGIAVHLS